MSHDPSQQILRRPPPLPPTPPPPRFRRLRMTCEREATQHSGLSSQFSVLSSRSVAPGIDQIDRERNPPDQIIRETKDRAPHGPGAGRDQTDQSNRSEH